MRAVFNSGIVVLAGVLALAACGDMGNLSRTSSENEYFACSLQPDPEAGPPQTSELLELALSSGDSPKATVLRRVALAGFDAIVR